MFYNIAKFILAIFFKIYLRFQIVGRNNFPKEGSFIVASNHLSYLDPVLLGLASPRKLTFLGRNSLFSNKAFGFLLSSLGTIAIRKNTSQNMGGFRKSFNILANKGCLAVFPEGTRSISGEIQKMNAGVGFLAIKSRCPVVPVLVVDTEKALPIKGKFIKPKKVMAYVGKILFPPNVPANHENSEKFSLKVEESIRDLSTRVKNANKLKSAEGEGKKDK